VGCTTTFEQTLCSIALLDRIKQRRPDVVSIIGAANCEGEMVEAIASLGPRIDYIFSGESDETFQAFLEETLRGSRPVCRSIRGRRFEEMKGQPTPRFDEFFD
jgi:radical SAM superfamily enzyme YgiQ (UPF0313 family)